MLSQFVLLEANFNSNKIFICFEDLGLFYNGSDIKVIEKKLFFWNFPGALALKPLPVDIFKVLKSAYCSPTPAQ